MDQSELFPLNIAQTDSMLDESGNGKGRHNVNISTIRAFAGENCDLAALEKAFWQIVADNDSLRLRLVRNGREVMQTIQNIEPFPLPRETADGEEGFLKLAEDFTDTDISLYDDILFRAKLIDCGAGAGGILIRIHHNSCDGYSLGMFIRELDDNYRKIIGGETPGKAKVYSFRSSVEHDLEYLSGPDYQADKKWWKSKIKAIRRCYFPVGRASSDNTSESLRKSLDKELSELLTGYCKETRISLQNAILALAGAYIASETKKKSFLVYCLSHNRTNFKHKQTAGSMVSCVPLYFEPDASQTGEAYLQACYTDYLDTVSHSRFPAKDNMRNWALLGMRSGMNFNVAWMQYSMMDFFAASRKTLLKTGVVNRPCLSPEVYLSLLNVPDEGITLQLEYRTKKLTRQRAEQLFDGFASFLTRFAACPTDTLGNLLKTEEK